MVPAVAFYPFQITAAGTKTITLSQNVGYYRVFSSGTIAIGAGQTVLIDLSGTPEDGRTITILYEADITLANSATAILNFGNLVVIKGDGSGEMPALFSSIKMIIQLFYSSGAWSSTVMPNFDDVAFVTSEALAADSVITAKIADNAVTYAKIQDFAARGNLLRAGAAGAPQEFAAVTSGQLVMGDGTDVVSQAVTGDVTITGGGVTAIAAGVIVNADVNASAAIAFSKLATLSSTNILVGSGANVATSVTVTGDVTISNTGVTAIGASKVTNTMMADDSVSLSNLDSNGMLYSYTTTTGTAANTTETTLASFAIPTHAMDADGEVLEVFAYGSCANTATVKTIRLRLGATLATATQLAVNTTTGSPQNVTWILRGKIFRTGAAAQKGTAEILFTAIATEIDNYTATETWSTSTVYLSGQNGTANANDIVLEGFEVFTKKDNNN